MPDKKLTVSASPHVRSAQTVSGIMLNVIIALIPALAASVWLFGLRVLLVCAVTVSVSVLSEYIARKVMKRHNTIGDLSAVVTGLILAFNLPVSIPLWMAAIGSVIAIVVAKQFFGGIGQNFVNPAIAGRIILMVSFPTAMTTWTAPFAYKSTQGTITTATPLAAEESELPSLLEMFLGMRGGSLGETCAAALIIGGLYLIIRKIISPSIPLSFIGTVAVIMLIAGKGDLSFVAYQLLSGGLMLGAFFMATDYATSPINFKGKIIFGIGCGIITSMIRLFGSLPEGVSFAIILMNILVPHIENLTTPKPFGTAKEKKSKSKEKEAAKA
ncbi:MAG: RnfABCDGE type electron transport complex subunit D [Clostridia bacterium]|nr:RnfABCDGE type electron transport complex subunit D [Oscillospiraceae bacterium]MDD6219559.1 RnfABCDGE type electron transport complex subunit D [Clostridia bacterium]